MAIIDAVSELSGSATAFNESRFHGKLWGQHGEWNIYFVDALRMGQHWIIECVVVGPRVHTVTIRCGTELPPGDTARRVMSTLTDWLASGDQQGEVYLQVPRLKEAC